MKLAFCGLFFNVSFQVFAESVTELFDLTKRFDCFDFIGQRTVKHCCELSTILDKNNSYDLPCMGQDLSLKKTAKNSIKKWND